MTRITDMRADLEGHDQQAALCRCISHHLQGRGHIVAALLQTAQLVNITLNLCVP